MNTDPKILNIYHVWVAWKSIKHSFIHHTNHMRMVNAEMEIHVRGFLNLYVPVRLL